MKRLSICTTAAILAVVAGCGSSASSSGTPGSAGTSTGLASPPDSHLKLVGTMTEAANSAAIAVTLRVGPIQYSPPPAAALDGCNVNDPAIVSTMAFSPAEVTIAYTEGSLVEQITIEPHYFLSGDDWQGWAAFDVHGRWQCQVDYGPLYLEFSAHSFENFPVWIMSQVLSNASPRVSTAEANSWQFPYLAITMSGALSPNVTTSGPDAERCGGQDVLMVYGHSCP